MTRQGLSRREIEELAKEIKRLHPNK